jgi:hypothetical protein
MLRRSRTNSTVPFILRETTRPEKSSAKIAPLPGQTRIKRLFGTLHLPAPAFVWPR